MHSQQNFINFVDWLKAIVCDIDEGNLQPYQVYYNKHDLLTVSLWMDKTNASHLLLDELGVVKDNLTLKERLSYYQLLGDKNG